MVPATVNEHTGMCFRQSFAVLCGLELNCKERESSECEEGGAGGKYRERERETDTDRHSEKDRETERERERLERYVCEYDYLR